MASLDRELEHVRDRVALVAHAQGRLVEALALTLLAAHEDVRQEVHLDLAHAVALARLAAAALHVEGEAAGLVAVHPRFGQLREEAADLVEDLDVGDRVAARRAPDRALVDVDHLVELLEPRDASGACPMRAVELCSLRASAG